MENSMQSDKKETILSYINKSKETLIDSQIALDNNRLENASNRIYYAIFNITISLGYLNNFITSKHQSLLGWFNKKFIFEDKIFSESMYVIYKDAFENRQGADYSIFVKFTKEEVQKSYNDAKLFIETLENYMLKKINDI